MNESILPVTQFLEDSFVYSCSFDKQRGHEQFVPHHTLAFQFSGETHIQLSKGTLVLRENQMLLARGNQLTKSTKIPGKDKEYKSMSILLTDAVLRQFAANNPSGSKKIHPGENNILLKPDTLMEGYFHSLLPYIEQSKSITRKLTEIKIYEAIELLLNLSPELKNFLFDFTEPFKIDLEKFMLQNYHFNVPIENFARLTGRSLAGFKRDFEKAFQTSPRKWLQEKRLEEAYRIIHLENKKPADIYIDLGFENLSHFYTCFKKKYGTTPAESLTIKKITK